ATFETFGEVVAREGRDYFRFVFPPFTESTGRRYDVSLTIRDGDLPALTPAVVEAPGRYYPDGDPAARGQLAFEAVYVTTAPDVVASLAGRLGGVAGERWAPAGAIVALFGLEAVLLAILLWLTARAGRTA
ncbi:MAG TPA: hypothetical protein VHL09_05555, partial [Dehalococcoidia bacterium]|nr:hypothetical protein [Dehalococcoidia bacterium]